MINLIVSGAAGRMGTRITALAHDHKDIKVVGALEQKGHPKAGVDIGEIIGTGKTGITVSADINDVKEKANVIIDFSDPEATVELSKIAAEKGIAMVIGTTGLSSEEINEIRSLTKKIPCVLAPNMSVGVNLLLKVLADVARVLGDDFDVEIVEAHHRLKKDAPSGTALKMAQVVANALNRNLDETAVYARKGLIGERTTKEIGIQSVRAGDIVGEHTVLFGGLGERIEITHKASSRDTFARGALKAALWVAEQKPGFYDMQDVLGLK
ncbi:MAG TPA: 4-hydroxy-tetrahydrodipicolinate reductase [Nitrospirae bacterium]|nr:4-hydroxy-tetrahydrodipicolinate reductase [bacterium BMS3Abin10]GBE38079.1 4-hydroxy-tetrahydrodipicolinate reductase [bacterium BMS3Bbin08]HDH50648.1 4-hydroxy-tetrahydrodipicolinate reductase [Nitrospirota bacterium]HDZ83944.1 4-hydroxy-tetrahydrodipicolinate reductase [Nitrospirota bacterium]